MSVQCGQKLCTPAQGVWGVVSTWLPACVAVPAVCRYEIHKLVVNRDPKHTNLVEVSHSMLHGTQPANVSCQTKLSQGSMHTHANHAHDCPCLCLLQYRTYKVIYRRYAGLFFSMCIDVVSIVP